MRPSLCWSVANFFFLLKIVIVLITFQNERKCMANNDIGFSKHKLQNGMNNVNTWKKDMYDFNIQTEIGGIFPLPFAYKIFHVVIFHLGNIHIFILSNLKRINLPKPFEPRGLHQEHQMLNKSKPKVD